MGLLVTTRRKSLLALALVLSLVSLGCGPPWVVVTAAIPNPFVGTKEFALEPMHFEDMTVGEKVESKYLATKDDEQKKSWEADKKAFDSQFKESLASSLPEAQFKDGKEKLPFLIRPRVMYIEPGFYAVTASLSTEVRITIEILNDQNEVIEIINLRKSVPGTLNNPSVGGRLKTAAEGLGEQAAQYLRTRIFP